ncbi:transposase [Calothrix sp. NIES-4071]|nr:transposase [Calothrix sp. NIES-4071]BAZ60479.1 transposase [Calothrix sp. NIES-4105]
MKIKLYPSKELHRIWKRWLAAYRFYYNQSIAILIKDYDVVTKTIIDKKTGKPKEVKITSDDLDKILLHLENIPEWVKTLPGHQRQEACSEAYDAFKQARSQGGEPKFKSCKATSQTIQFKVGNFKRGTWYCSTTKGLKFSSFQSVPQDCEYGTELVYKRGEWFGCFPQCVEEIPTGSERVIALDPGNRTFLTGYDGENILEIGKGDIGLIQRLCLHLDQLIGKGDKAKSRQKYRIKKAIKRARTRIQNLIKDLHNKAVSLLVNSYKVIFLPTFDSSQMVCKINGKGKKRKINSKSARQMLTLSHYKFEQHLKQAAQRKGVIVVLCNESYTSKSCGSCGHIYEVGSSKTHSCPNCGTKTSRDVNGARNIMLRSLVSLKFSVSDNSIILSDAPQGIVGNDQERHVENVLL